ncbi:MAG: 2-thiouracil desulfurase family protein [Sedimentibacter sp.]
MLFISSDKLKPGMVLAMDLILYNKYNFKSLLLREGQALNNTYINKICSNNISGAYIKNEVTFNNLQKNIISEEFEADTLTRIKDIFYKYKLENYKFDNRLIWQISDLADDLIEETIFTKALLYRNLEYNNREDYVFQHSLNVAILSISLGNSLELSQHMIHELALAALLHDIGMLQVPNEILYKQEDYLTEGEFKAIKMHPVNAVKALKHFVSNDVLRGIASHHEHIDGTGYPYRLNSDKIHLFGKVLAVCDVYQALKTDYSFKKAWNPAQIIKYLNENKNTKFDEEISEKFLSNIIVYPEWNYVKLNNGKTAIVVHNNTEDCLKPVVQIINPNDSLGEKFDLMNNENEYIEISDKGHHFEYIVSACLCGEKTRYDGKASTSEKIKTLVDEGKAIMVCPEVLGGLNVPRLPCEIRDGRVVNISSDDKTDYFVDGAIKTLETAKKYGIKKAILKEKSPSCGSNYIYDGTFSKSLIHGQGITTRLLRLNDIEVISDEEFEKA